MQRVKKKYLVVTLAVAAAFSQTGFAETNAEFALDEYVVTATKTRMEAREIPQAVEVISQEKIKELGAYSVQDALRLAVNIDTQDTGMTGIANQNTGISGNAVQIRGMATKYTLILVDGKRLAAENSDESTNIYALKRINIAEAERIEVIRGNSSALYGSDALGGVINIITKKATEPSMTLEAHTGTQDTASSFNYTSGRQGKVSVKIGGAIEKVREINTGTHTSYTIANNTATHASTAYLTNMYGTRRHLHTGINYDFDTDHSLELELNFMREQLHTAGYDSDGADYRNGIPVMGMKMPIRYEMYKHYAYDNNRADYSLQYKGKDGKHDYNLRTYYSQLRKENYTAYDNIARKTASLIDFDTNNYKSLVLEAKDTYTPDDHNTLTFGVEYKKNSMEGTLLSDGGYSLDTRSYGDIVKQSSKADEKTGAFYVQDVYALGDKLVVIPAVRVDHHDTYGTYTSPKLGATYSFSKHSRAKVNWGKGFRAPTLFELYAHMSKEGMMPLTVNVLGNEALEPEKSVNFDFSLEAEKDKFTSKLSYFHNKIEKMIDIDTYSGATGPGLWYRYYNHDGKTVLEGVEAELSYSFDKHWSLKGAYVYLDAKDERTGQRLTNRARQNGLVQLTYTDAKTNPLTVNLYNKFYIDYRATNNADVQGAGSLAGQRFSYTKDYTYGVTGIIVNKQWNKHLRLYAGVDNIFDKTYAFDTFNTYYVYGRTWRLGAEWKF